MPFYAYRKRRTAKRFFKKRRSTGSWFNSHGYGRNVKYPARSRSDYLMAPTDSIKTRAPQKFALMGAMPPTFFGRHRYVEALDLNGTIGGITVGAKEYTLSGMFDPYLGVGGHQPYGFDQMAAWYGLYTVYRVSVQIQVISANQAAAALVWRVKPFYATTPFNGLLYEDFLETPNGGAQVASEVFSNNKVQTFDLGTWDINQIEGVDRDKIMDELNYSGTVTGNPLVQPVLQLGCCNAQLINDPSIRVIVTLVYHARWSGRTTQLRSSV